MSNNNASSSIASPPSPPPPPPPPPPAPPSWTLALYIAITQGDWEVVKPILDSNPEAINTPLGGNAKETALIAAIKAGQPMPFIQNLIDRMQPGDLLRCDALEMTALHAAALVGNIPVAKELIARNPQLPHLRTSRDQALPIHKAAGLGQREMTLYLHGVTKLDAQFDPEKDLDGNDLIQLSVGSGMYDFALHLLQQDPKLPWRRECPIGSLAHEPSSFRSGTRLNFLQRILYSWIPITEDQLLDKLKRDLLENSSTHTHTSLTQPSSSRAYQGVKRVVAGVTKILVKPIKDVHQSKLMHYQALAILRTVTAKIKNMSPELVANLISPPLLLAILNGIPEIVEEIANVFPHAIKFNDAENRTTLQIAAMYRHEKIFNLLYERCGKFAKVSLLNSLDRNRDSTLHLVSYKAEQYRLDTHSGTVLQMQRELRWYKKVENLMLPQLRTHRNKKGKTPLMIFNEEHKDMVEYEGQWILGMANSCIVGGSLIATVVFAAAITVPGGNSDDGLPVFTKDMAFKVFAFSDVCALVFSFITVLVFLSIFTARYSVNDYVLALPKRLIIGITSLFLSVTFSMIAFSAIVYLMFDWLIAPVSLLACLPVIFFAQLQMPSLLSMIKSTYGHSNSI